MGNARLRKQLQFILEIDKLKTVLRQSPLIDQSRKENDAEHSWHLAVMAILLSEYAKERHMDIFHVVKLVLIHDLVEIDAGDTFCYDKIGNSVFLIIWDHDNSKTKYQYPKQILIPNTPITKRRSGNLSEWL